MLPKNQDLNIFYSGGSGGFILFHLMLLTHRHFAVYYNLLSYKWYCKHSAPLQYRDYLYAVGDFYKKHVTQTIDHAAQHWNPDRPTWKHGEMWPDNHTTNEVVLPQGLYKIFLNCNKISSWQSFPGHKVLLYTDIRTQVRMCWFKRAKWFYNSQQSLMSQRPLLRQLFQQSVAADVEQAWPLADTRICLQDLIKKSNWNNDQLELIKKWKAQHPQILLKKTGLL